MTTRNKKCYFLLALFMLIFPFLLHSGESSVALTLGSSLSGKGGSSDTLYVFMRNRTEKELTVPSFFDNVSLRVYLFDSLGNFYPDQLQPLQALKRTKLLLNSSNQPSAMVLFLKPGFNFRLVPSRSYYILCITRSCKGNSLLSTGIHSFFLNASFRAEKFRRIPKNDIPPEVMANIVKTMNQDLSSSVLAITKDSSIFQ